MTAQIKNKTLFLDCCIQGPGMSATWISCNICQLLQYLAKKWLRTSAIKVETLVSHNYIVY